MSTEIKGEVVERKEIFSVHKRYGELDAQNKLIALDTIQQWVEIQRAAVVKQITDDKPASP